jgi:dTDP-4-amino-4,6-dideoxygalactose transaminase
MRRSYLPFSRPWMDEAEIAEVSDTLRSDWITTGPKVAQFERNFSAAVGAQAVLAVSSCTAALHLALTVLGIGAGDAVITTPMTFCSTVHVIEHVGARPVLVDVEPDTLNLDPAAVSETLERITEDSPYKIGRVKAILPVHLYGHPCELDSLLEIASRYKLALVEDAAHSLPAKYKGKTIGSFAGSSPVPMLTAFSFYATKNLATGEGGMLAGPADMLDEARIWSLHGMNRDAWKRYSSEGSWFYEVTCAGFKYNMADIQAAIGLHQLRKLNMFHQRRIEIVRRYNEAFSAMEEFELPADRDEVEHAWHLYVLRLNLDHLTVSRNPFIEELRARNIASSVHFIPVHLHPYYRDKYAYKPDDFPVAHREYNRLISLPLFPKMTDHDVDDVINAVSDVARKYRVVNNRSGQPRLVGTGLD